MMNFEPYRDGLTGAINIVKAWQDENLTTTLPNRTGAIAFLEGVSRRFPISSRQAAAIALSNADNIAWRR